MIAPKDMINNLQVLPYGLGCNNMLSADCWGIVELWYMHVLGIAIAERGSRHSNRHSLQLGFEDSKLWHEIKQACDHCLVIMRAGRINAGHVGIYYANAVIHTDKTHGCRYQNIEHPLIKTRITHLMQYKNL